MLVRSSGVQEFQEFRRRKRRRSRFVRWQNAARRVPRIAQHMLVLTPSPELLNFWNSCTPNEPKASS
jgi:hypothetical protein